MNLTDPILELLAYEVAVIFAVIAGVLLFKNLKKKRRVDADTAKTVKHIKNNRENREAELQTLLAEHYQLSGDELEQEVKAFAEREREIYKSLVKTFIEQDGKAFTALPAQLEQAVNSALAKMPPQTEVEQEPEAEADTEMQTAAEAEEQPQDEQSEEAEAPEEQALSEQSDEALEAETDEPEAEQAVIDEEVQFFSDAGERLSEDSIAEESASAETESVDEMPPEEAEVDEDQNATINDDLSSSVDDIEIEPAADISEAPEEALRTDEIEALLDGQDFTLEQEGEEVASPDDIEIEASQADEQPSASDDAEQPEEPSTILTDEAAESGPAELTDLDDDFTPRQEYRQAQNTDETLERFADIGEDIEIPGDPNYPGKPDSDKEAQPEATEVPETEKPEPQKKGLHGFVTSDSFHFQPQTNLTPGSEAVTSEDESAARDDDLVPADNEPGLSSDEVLVGDEAIDELLDSQEPAPEPEPQAVSDQVEQLDETAAESDTPTESVEAQNESTPDTSGISDVQDDVIADTEAVTAADQAEVNDSAIDDFAG